MALSELKLKKRIEKESINEYFQNILCFVHVYYVDKHLCSWFNTFKMNWSYLTFYWRAIYASPHRKKNWISRQLFKLKVFFLSLHVRIIASMLYVSISSQIRGNVQYAILFRIFFSDWHTFYTHSFDLTRHDYTHRSNNFMWCLTLPESR